MSEIILMGIVNDIVREKAISTFVYGKFALHIHLEMTRIYMII